MLKYILVIVLPLLVTCWWDVGHMLTAAIAEIRLNQLNFYASANFKQLTLTINHLCDNRTRTFIECAVWADDIKERNYSMDIWNDWHFTDTQIIFHVTRPYVTDAMIPTINYTAGVLNSIATVGQAVNVLKTNINKLTAERSLFSRYLVHLIGDIHQPLHSVSLFNHTFPKGDAGGNLLKLKLLNGTVQNFHSFWDSGAFLLQNDSYQFRRPMNLQNSTELKRLAKQMIDTYGKQVEQNAKILDPLIWAKESFLIAQNTTYPHLMKTNIANQQYTKLVHETSKRRITLAGYRLANVAIDIYDPSSKYLNLKTKQENWKILVGHSNQINLKQGKNNNENQKNKNLNSE